MDLKPWRRSFILHDERTVGQVGLRKNGTYIDIWIRILKVPFWFSIKRADLVKFLAYGGKETIIPAESNGNSEHSFDEDVAEGLKRDN